MVDRIRYPTVSYLPFYYVFFQFLLLTIFNLQANILTTKDILSNLVRAEYRANVPCRYCGISPNNDVPPILARCLPDPYGSVGRL